MVSKDGLEKFKQIYEKEFGEKLSNSEAMEKAVKFLNLMRVVSRPTPKGAVVNGEAK